MLANVKDYLAAQAYAGEIEGGADTVEYTIVLLIVVAIGVALFALKDQVVGFIEASGTQISEWSTFS